MPLYAYRCEDCGEESEHIQKFSDPPLTECESCGGSLVKKMSTPAFHLKGGGWYKDGYASSSGDGGGSSDSGSGGGSSSSSESSSGSGSKKDKPKKSEKKKSSSASKKS